MGKMQQRKGIGYLALALCILTTKTPEEAFIELAPMPGETSKDVITQEDVRDMVVLKEKYKLSYRKIGEMYNLSEGAVYRRIKRYKERKDAAS